MAEVSNELMARFRAHEGRADHRERVVVTLRPGADPEEAAQAGLWIEHVMQAVPVVTGTLDRSALTKLSGTDAVVRIEPDQEMRALGS